MPHYGVQMSHYDEGRKQEVCFYLLSCIKKENKLGKYLIYQQRHSSSYQMVIEQNGRSDSFYRVKIIQDDNNDVLIISDTNSPEKDWKYTILSTRIN